MFYWLLKYVLGGPLLRMMYHPRFQGVENVPLKGPVIVAANHLSFADSLFIPLGLRRRVVFLGKSAYFEKRRTAWFFRWAGVIPVKRDSGKAGEAALIAGLEVLKGGGAIGIYPEGTRSPDGKVYRGKTGVARLALDARCPVIPVVVFGTRDLQPPDRKMLKLSGRVRVVYGEPLTFERYLGQERDRYVLRAVTDEIMYEIMLISGQEYVDEYAAKVRRTATSSDAPGPQAVPEAPAPVPAPAENVERNEPAE